MISNPSPYKLLQEILWPNRWQSTVGCVLLNLTKRSQVDRVWPILFQKAPDPESILEMDTEELRTLLKPLGLSNKRTERLKRLAKEWIEGVEFDKLHGIGEYAKASDQIFYRGILPESVKDHALASYLSWKKLNDCKNN